MTDLPLSEDEGEDEEVGLEEEEEEEGTGKRVFVGDHVGRLGMGCENVSTSATTMESFGIINPVKSTKSYLGENTLVSRFCMMKWDVQIALQMHLDVRTRRFSLGALSQPLCDAAARYFERLTKNAESADFTSTGARMIYNLIAQTKI
ncbi:hypothetical protein V1478_002843 [Vespula squamosa]|uniref:Uncharacterized protein n=1 Tax=Vespula squamosa TaxID=30214 RepID=A0ABD2BQZ1_VESSQ